ncbi:MAG: glycoside hydrolase family 2 protein [Lachnospiraceae bacterium]|nr:glycoside hydrolase family 2 protein [Lachnospiraceae bacterium]
MRQIIDLNYKWAFSKEAGEIPQTIPAHWYWVNLPHSWNNIDGQDGGNDYYRGTCYYAKEIDKSELPESEQYYLEFRGANASADVYLNGKKLASHDGGYSTWRVNITDALENQNLLVVAVDNGINDRVYPQNADFTFYGGLYRNVSIIAVKESHFDLDYYGGPGIRVTPEINGADANVEVEVYLTNAKAGQELFYQLKAADGTVVAEGRQSADTTQATFKIENVHLWHGRKDPYLYTAEVTLMDGENVLDTVSTRFGCRTFEIDPEKGFILNGESYPLHGVSRHQDRWGLGNALLPEHHEEDMDLICEMGANTIRLAHYQHDQYFYDLCDERGMVIWAEIPYISSHMPTGRENTISQMKELVIQNYNHPSIVVWGLSNEITMTGKSNPDMIENHNILNDMVHEMDKTRLTTIAVVSMCDIHDPYIQIPDVVSHNHYFGWYGGDTSMNGPWFDNFHKEYPNIPVGMSEYGCEALDWHTSNPMQGDYTEEYQAYYHEELIKQLFTRPYIWATHVWNMFDFGADARCEGGENGQNHKGLITFDRKYKKDSFYAYKAWLSDEPFVHICGKRYVDRVEEETKVTVYSNLPEVELFVNGKSLGKQTSEEHFFYFSVPNAGESVLTAVAGDCKDESHIRKVEVFNEAYRLKEKGAVLNWFDITEVEGCYSLNDKMSDVMKAPAGQELFMGLMKQIGMQKEGQESMIKAENMGPMMEMMGGFTVLRLLKLFGAANVNLTKEQMLGLNEQLNQIKRVE